jgi:hypothetical protein
MAARALIPEKAELIHHYPELKSELPTIAALRKWSCEHKDWMVFYHHAKGLTYSPTDALATSWRVCMERCCIWNWMRCVQDLEHGCDSVGAHWCTPEEYPGLVKAPFWGGNFWWAKASFLSTLPELPETASCRNDFYLAESWIGLGNRRPIVKDNAHHWPSITECQKTRV